MALLARTGHGPLSSHQAIRLSASCGLVYSESRLARLGLGLGLGPRPLLDSSPAWVLCWTFERGERLKSGR